MKKFVGVMMVIVGSMLAFGAVDQKSFFMSWAGQVLLVIGSVLLITF
jgi:hypothetical protein